MAFLSFRPSTFYSFRTFLSFLFGPGGRLLSAGTIPGHPCRCSLAPCCDEKRYEKVSERERKWERERERDRQTETERVREREGVWEKGRKGEKELHQEAAQKKDRGIFKTSIKWKSWLQRNKKFDSKTWTKIESKPHSLDFRLYVSVIVAPISKLAHFILLQRYHY